MELNKLRYKILNGSEKVYFSISEEELRKKLNDKFSKSVAEDDMTGILGKYKKHNDFYKIKYIYTRNNQLQPKTADRYYIIAKTGTDEKGTYLEHLRVYDRFVDPMIRISYVFTVTLIILCLFYLMSKNMLDKFSTYILSGVAFSTVFIVMKKPNESEEYSKKAEVLLKKLIVSL